jgi:hypothetical protein
MWNVWGKSTIRVLVGKPEFRDHSCIREDNTKTNLEDIGKEDFDLIILAQDGPSGRVIRTR